MTVNPFEAFGAFINTDLMPDEEKRGLRGERGYGKKPMRAASLKTNTDNTDLTRNSWK